MKKIIAITCISLSIMFALFSCKSPNNIVDNTQSDYINAIVGADTFSVTGSKIIVIDTFGLVSIEGVSTASKTNNSVITISLNAQGLVPGKYYLNIGSNPNRIYYAKSGALPDFATSGIVTINTISSSVISGTFNCTLPDSTTITKGKFNVIY